MLLLPLAHGWQHIAHSRYGRGLTLLLSGCERLGLIATRADHRPHHVKGHATVYQSFSSSGIFSRQLDILMDRVWDNAVNTARSPRRPFDVLAPMAAATWAAVWLVPLVCFAVLENGVSA